jgi:hypothetical protein
LAGRVYAEDKRMLKKTIIGLFAVAAIGMLSPNVASARGGFHGGGFHGGGFHGGFGGAGLAAGAIGLGLGLAAAPYAYGYGIPTATIVTPTTAAHAIWYRDGFGHRGVGVSTRSKCATNDNSAVTIAMVAALI